MQDKYVKVVYQTPPLGESKIILYLTTFDLEAYKRDQEIKNKTYVKEWEIEPGALYHLDFQAYIEDELNRYVRLYYDPLIKQLREECERTLKPITLLDNVGNVTNSGDVHCNIVKGNVVNCDNIYCNEIKGNVVNCDKIVYKNKE